MTSILHQITIQTAEASIGYGSRPGFVICLNNPVGNGNENTYHLTSVSFFTNAAPGMGMGFSDHVQVSPSPRYAAASNGDTGPVGPGQVEEGQNRFGGGKTLAFSADSGAGGQNGSLDPICNDAQWVAGTGALLSHKYDGLAAALVMGNRCKAKAGTFDLNGSTGDQAVTGIGFVPDAVFFLGCSNAQSDGNNFLLGVMGADGEQWSLATRSYYLSAPTGIGGNGQVLRYSRFKTDACISHIGSPGYGIPTTVDQLASFVSMDSDGFTINLSAAGHDSSSHVMTVAFLAVQILTGHGSIQVGNGVQGDTSLTCGFEPDVMMFASAQTLDGTISTNSFTNVGFTDGTVQVSAWEGTKSGTPEASPPPSQAYYSTSKVMRFAQTSSTLKADATVAFTGTGAAITWTTNDSVARLFGWVAFQTESLGAPTVTTGAAGSPPGVASLTGTISPQTNPGDDVSYHFQWGTTTGYGNVTSTSSAGSGTSDVNVSSFISGLSDGTTYHYRLVVVDQYGCITNGDDQTFVAGTDAPSQPYLNAEFSTV